MKLNIDGSGEVECICTAYTPVIYEQEFGKSLIADFYGKIDLRDSNGELVPAEFVENTLQRGMPVDDETGVQKPLPKTTKKLIHECFPEYVTAVIDYTRDNWDATMRVIWAMYATAREIAGEQYAPFKKWLIGLGPIDIKNLNNAAYEETQRGLFHTAD